MIKSIVACLWLALVVFSAVPTYASEEIQPVLPPESVSEGTITAGEVFLLTTKTYTRQETIVIDGTTIAVINLTATFSYDGNTVTVIAKEVTLSNTYNGWEYRQNMLTSNSGTVTLDAKLTKWLILNTNIHMSITCDKDGNISWT